jgi:ribosomal protein S18 acetylase RimI-like enzyme
MPGCGRSRRRCNVPAVMDLDLIDRYLHTVPLSGARPHEVGPFTLFRSTTAWSYYARPRPGAEADLTVDDVQRLRARCHELGLPLSLEWVLQTAPSLAGAAGAAGLDVVQHPLLIVRAGDFVPAPPRADVRVEILLPDRRTLVAARAVADVGFGNLGTEVGDPGAEARNAHLRLVAPARAEALLARARAGVTVTAVALGPDGEPVASGQHQPVGACTEVVAVATLPAYRRRGLASAVTSTLVEHAFQTGVELVLLSAQSADVARLYQRLGFTAVGAVGAAEPTR